MRTIGYRGRGYEDPSGTGGEGMRTIGYRGRGYEDPSGTGGEGMRTHQVQEERV